MNKTPVRILCLAGSTRAQSLNARLARHSAYRLTELGAEAEFLDLRAHPVPMYDEDLEAKGLPGPVEAIAKAVDAADGVLIASPEYNAGMTGVLKNVLDWCSRVPSSRRAGRVFSGKAVAVVAASPGSLGGVRGLAQARLVLTEMGAHVSPTDAIVPAAHESLGEDGRPTNERSDKMLGATLGRLVELARRLD